MHSLFRFLRLQRYDYFPKYPRIREIFYPFVSACQPYLQKSCICILSRQSRCRASVTRRGCPPPPSCSEFQHERLAGLHGLVGREVVVWRSRQHYEALRSFRSHVLVESDRLTGGKCLWDRERNPLLRESSGRVFNQQRSLLIKAAGVDEVGSVRCVPVLFRTVRAVLPLC